MSDADSRLTEKSIPMSSPAARSYELHLPVAPTILVTSDTFRATFDER